MRDNNKLSKGPEGNSESEIRKYTYRDYDDIWNIQLSFQGDTNKQHYDKFLSTVKYESTDNITVKDVMSSFKTFIVHGIQGKPNVPPEFQYDPKQLSVEKKFDAFVDGKATEVSASVLRPGREFVGKHSLHSRMGVILSEGEITFASPFDSSTKIMEETKNRVSVLIEGKEPPKVSDSVKLALGSPANYKNELVIKKPKISGVYICLENAPEQYIGYKKLDYNINKGAQFELDIDEVIEIINYAEKNHYHYMECIIKSCIKLSIVLKLGLLSILKN